MTPERPRTPKVTASPNTMARLKRKFPGWFTPPRPDSPTESLELDCPRTEAALQQVFERITGCTDNRTAPIEPNNRAARHNARRCQTAGKLDKHKNRTRLVRAGGEERYLDYKGGCSARHGRK